MEPSDNDDQVSLKLVLTCISLSCSRLFKDHLPGGKHSEMGHDPASREKLKSVQKHAESVFGRLDQLLICKPSITTITEESLIGF